MKVLICDYVGISAQWLEQCAINENFEIVDTITPSTDKNLMAEKDLWDYLLVFENGKREFFESIIQFMNISPARVVFALDWKSWMEHPAAVYALLDPKKNGGVGLYRAVTFNAAWWLGNYFVTCTTADGLHFIATSKDTGVIRATYIERRTWAENGMNLFQALVKMFYEVDESDGLFLDLGANIGTTGIYFTKKLTPNLKLLAFEPDPENFKLLRMNLILNDAEKNSIAENYGLGDEESEMTMYRLASNPGGNSVYGNLIFGDNEPTATVKIIPLDKYFAENKLSAKDIKYIWIDTEGSEPQVLFGMKNILTENPAPIFMEFNPHVYQKIGVYDKLMEFLSQFYKGWVLVQHTLKTGEIEVHPIEKLWEYQNVPGQIGDIFFVHEIKNFDEVTE